MCSHKTAIIQRLKSACPGLHALVQLTSLVFKMTLIQFKVTYLCKNLSLADWMPAVSVWSAYQTT